MPKQKYTLRSFAGGINTVKDPRDLEENEASQIDNMSIDAQGKIKSAGTLNAHSVNPSIPSGTALTKYISVATARLDQGTSNPGTATGRSNKGGGFNLFYFESDHSKKHEFNDNASVTYTISVSGATHNISFVAPQNSDVTGTAAVSPADADSGGSGSSA